MHRELLKDMMDLSVEITKDWYKKNAKVDVGMMVGIHTVHHVEKEMAGGNTESAQEEAVGQRESKIPRHHE